MKRVHIIGGKNHGKTTLIVELIREFHARGLCVGTIKHTHHQHELDAPGKDSHRHREAGASVVGVLSRSMHAVFWPPQEDDLPGQDSRYDSFAPLFAQCDLVLVEGDTHTTSPKIEVWRESLGTPPLAQTDPTLIAVVSHDNPTSLAVPVWPRADVAFLAQQVRAFAVA